MKISYKDRQLIEKLRSTGFSPAYISNLLNVHVSTIYREMARGSTGRMDENGNIGYSADLAQQKSLKLEGSR